MSERTSPISSVAAPIDGCPSCVRTYNRPTVVVDSATASAQGITCHYRCSGCGHEWVTAWGATSRLLAYDEQPANEPASSRARRGGGATVGEIMAQGRAVAEGCPNSTCQNTQPSDIAIPVGAGEDVRWRAHFTCADCGTTWTSDRPIG